MAYGLDEKKIKDILIEGVNRNTDQMLYLDDSTVDIINGLADGVANALVKHVDCYMKDWMRDIEIRARVGL
jgi:hypothetical protein